ncbi:MAG TPA: ATP-binding cassette domain-containing protein [Deinococcales bacterium]|nr:ATP-binding cassette domain-containing protein [Deinococcales bacterium]
MIEVTDLTKKFGDVTAVDAVSFSVPAGQVFGLLGPNGAGKTTTLRMLATLIRPSAGSARVTGLGLRDDPAAVRRNIGVVNGGMGLYDRLTGREILRYFGRLYDMTDARIRERIAALDAVLDLKATLDRQAGGFSTGMKQKIVIARAVLHDPPVIFFDEASSGLDVMARRALLDFVRNYPGTDRAVIYSTHVMTEVEELCDRLAIMSEGRLVAEGTVASLAEQTGADSLEGAFFRLVRPEAVA